MAFTRLRSGKLTSEVYKAKKSVLFAVEDLCQTREGKEKLGNSFLVPLVDSITKDSDSGVSEAGCINAMICHSPKNRRIITRRKANSVDNLFVPEVSAAARTRN
jgi:hypothetical protein